MSPSYDWGGHREDDRPIQSSSQQLVGLRGSQETVIHIARVKVVSRDRADRVVAIGTRALAGACARSRNVERCKSTVLSERETVEHIA